MPSKSSINLRRRKSGSSSIPIHNNRSMVRVALNPREKRQRKDDHSQHNYSKPPTKKSNEKLNKDTKKWCMFQTIPWHNADECRSKNSLLSKKKSSRSDVDLDTDSKLENGKWIIDTKPNVTIATTNV
jgi:hypothetical protein